MIEILHRQVACISCAQVAFLTLSVSLSEANLAESAHLALTTHPAHVHQRQHHKQAIRKRYAVSHAPA